MFSEATKQFWGYYHQPLDCRRNEPCLHETSLEKDQDGWQSDVCPARFTLKLYLQFIRKKLFGDQTNVIGKKTGVWRVLPQKQNNNDPKR